MRGLLLDKKNDLMPKLSYFLKFSGLLIFKSSTTGISFYDVLARVEEAIKNVGPKVSHFLVNVHKICKKILNH